MFEIDSGELRATFLGNHTGDASCETTADTTRRPLHPLRGAAPVTGHDTRSEEVHCLQIGCAPNHKNKRGIREMTTDTHQAPGARSV